MITDIDDIPSYVKVYSDEIIKLWIARYNFVLENYDVDMALVVANEWLSIQSSRINVIVNISPEEEEVIESSKELVTFEMSDTKLIKKADGRSYVDFILSDTGIDRDGQRMSEGLLKSWAKNINDDGLTIKGDTNHKLYDMLVEQGREPSDVIEMLRRFKEGIAKSVKASYSKGKLWLRALIDPEYEDVILNSNGVSLEAEVTFDKNKVGVTGSLGGFTFATGSFNPRNARANKIELVKEADK